MRKILFGLALAVLPQVTIACEIPVPFDLTKIGNADLVLVGEVVSYDEFGIPPSALVTVRVEQVLKGKADESLTLVWNPGLVQYPDSAIATGQVLLGAMAPGHVSETPYIDARPDLPELMQNICGDAWIVPATEAAVAQARAALK